MQQGSEPAAEPSTALAVAPASVAESPTGTAPVARELERDAERAAKAEARRAAVEAADAKRAESKALSAANRAKAAHAREVAKANRGFDQRHAEWASLNSEVQSALQTARTFQPSGGEYFGTPAQLIEQRAGARTYVGASRGVSIPVGSIGGRSIRYRAGATKGHVVQGDPVDKVIDSGRVVVTAAGVNFVGANQTRVSDYKKMVDLSITNGELRISVSNRQKITRVRPAASQLTGLMLAIHIAQADASGSRDDLIAQLEAEAARIASTEPQRAI